MTDLLDGVGFAAGWRDSPSLAAQDGADPTSVRDRFAIYRYLVERTGSAEVVGEQREHHVFWGYASQLHWQQGSGRLSDPRAPPAPVADEIATESWWGAMNYTLCVTPLRAATRGGFVPWVDVPPEPFERHLEGATVLWQRFFAKLARARSVSDLPRLRAASWRAHLASIRAGTVVHGRKWELLSAPERRFALGWTRMVDFFGAAALPTDLLALRRLGTGTLPPRRLDASDAPGRIRDFSAEENRTLRAVCRLADRSPVRFAWDTLLWSRAMRAPTLQREAGRILFENATKDPALRRRLMLATVAPRRVAERL